MPASAQSALVKPFDPSSCAAARDGPKAGMPAAARSSTMPGDQRRLRADHHEVDLVVARQKATTAAWSADVERDELGVLGDAGIARRREEPRQLRRLRELPGERMLAAARADEEHIHAPSR